jgi:hypothetical protein
MTGGVAGKRIARGSQRNWCVEIVALGAAATLFAWCGKEGEFSPGDEKDWPDSVPTLEEEAICFTPFSPNVLYSIRESKNTKKKVEIQTILSALRQFPSCLLIHILHRQPDSTFTILHLLSLCIIRTVRISVKDRRRKKTEERRRRRKIQMITVI